MTIPTMHREIVYAGADERGPSMLRMVVPEGLYVAVIEADGTWWGLTVPPDDETQSTDQTRPQ
jgi:hypothetical protein